MFGNIIFCFYEININSLEEDDCNTFYHKGVLDILEIDYDVIIRRSKDSDLFFDSK
jgi:hypothetical protein